MFWLKDTVDKIVADFDSVKKRLLDHAEAKTTEQAEHLSNAQDSRSKADVASKEATRARSIAAKIEEMLK